MCRKLVGAKHLRVRHEDCKREHRDDRTDKNASELGKKLLTGIIVSLEGDWFDQGGSMRARSGKSEPKGTCSDAMRLAAAVHEAALVF